MRAETLEQKCKSPLVGDLFGNKELKRLNSYLCASPCPPRAEVTQRIVWQQTIKTNDCRLLRQIQNPAYRCTIYEKEHRKVFFFIWNLKKNYIFYFFFLKIFIMPIIPTIKPIKVRTLPPITNFPNNQSIKPSGINNFQESSFFMIMKDISL